MQFELIYQPSAEATLANIEQTDLKKYRKILKTLALMETNLRHPSLQTHKARWFIRSQWRRSI
ncbi:hypothetical protein [Scytonema hofmannii]|uniref:hypothetical protein n=1 Tax=Scytonema hofmannii TaxID=34078 RepID=UPI00034B9EB8|nr:hypothetical protein [Scytonema hofmannii]